LSRAGRDPAGNEVSCTGGTVETLASTSDAAASELDSRAGGLENDADLRQNRLVDDALDVGQPHVAPGMAIGQALVIEAEQVQNRGVQVVDVHGVFNGLIAQFVGLPIGDAQLHSATGQPDAESLVVISPIGVLPVGRATKLASPDHQRIIQQAQRSQVGQQAGNGPIDGQGIPRVSGQEAAVLVPVALRKFDEADAGQQ
jgi:hypothetical protein